MKAADCIDLADMVLKWGGVTPERYAEAKGVTAGGAPVRLLLTEEQAADALQVSPRTLRRLVAEDDKLANCRRNLRNAVRYHAAELAAWTNENPKNGKV